MGVNLARLFSYTQLIEENLRSTKLELKIERDGRVADNEAWARRLEAESQRWQAKIDELQAKLLYVVGVPEQKPEVPQSNEYRPPDPSLPGQRSYQEDLKKEEDDLKYLQAEYQRMMRNAHLEAQLETFGPDGTPYSG